MYLGLVGKRGMSTASVVRVRCPECHHTVRLEMIHGELDHEVELEDGRTVYVGVRHCPEETCGQIVFVVTELVGGGREIIFTAPRETLDFDTTDLPTAVLSCMQEAAVCFTNDCYVAAAIMIRKTLEEMCEDRSATGANLAERLQSLGSLVILPPALLAGMNSLRLLGNDAAHIESKTFSEIGRDEIQVSFDVAKEVLKAVYQYDALIAQLDALKK
ncbi:DUF4145 domain-containing protein [Nocardioides sp. CN2-186]|uniref:DUF4145 domain-containing protein n=1 Tax=Nocardioides tweenelious TaxID=3156607 RepID=UPI0032B3EFC3